ncbi:MAG: class II aldolase/adducin family protein [Gemmataceae bacterium]|nr:class II aldolase/adducin family protein [Gemmataceae bacterium]
MHEDLKHDLCCSARVLYRAGLSAGIAGHLSIKVNPGTMLANRFGPSFGTVMPEDVLTLDLDGNVLEGQGRVNDTIRLHGVIHRRNPEVIALAHTHPPAVVTFSTLRTVPEVYDQESCFLAGEVGVVEEDYSGLASTEERVQPFAEGLARYHALILPNHGAITRGNTIQEAAIWMLGLEQMAGRHLSVAAAARATGLSPRPVSPEVARATRKELMDLNALGLVWADLLARLQKTDPDLLARRAAPGP